MNIKTETAELSLADVHGSVRLPAGAGKWKAKCPAHPDANPSLSISAGAAPSGQVFLDWTGAAVTNANIAATTLTMPAASITVNSNNSITAACGQ